MTQSAVAPPTQDVIHLWLINDQTIDDPSLLSQYQSWLSRDELERFNSISDASVGHQYLVTRALVRSVLSLYKPDLAPRDWRFGKNNYAKPFIHPDQLNQTLCGLSFNISHTEELIVLAVARGVELGVDCEHHSRPGFTPELANHYFAPSEVAALNSLPSIEQRDRVLDLWTLKEAFIKARGKGLTIKLNSFAYEFIQDTQLKLHTALHKKLSNNVEEDIQHQAWLLHHNQHSLSVVTEQTNNQAFKLIARTFIPKDLSPKELSLDKSNLDNSELDSSNLDKHSPEKASHLTNLNLTLIRQTLPTTP